MRRVIKVFEHEKLTLSKNARGECLSEKELQKLYELNDRHNNEYFTGIRAGIKFSNYVGVVQIGTLTIEILPKADKKLGLSASEHEVESTKWRNALLSMMTVCKKLKLDSVSKASLNKRYHSLLDLYFDIYITEVAALLRKGLVKKYHSNSSNTTALKGRIDFSKHIQQNAVHLERFYTTHQVYDYEHLINQILLKGLNILAKVTSDRDLKDRINRIKLDFPVISEIEITLQHFNQLRATRKTLEYSEALNIAKMIILNYSPDIKNGQENMLALLFDMNKLWEEYIFRMLQREKREGVLVEFQNSQKFWENKTIRPDIVITVKNGKVTENFVIDTKWKVIDSRNPSDDDLKQMYAYNMYWEAERSLLLYPKVKAYEEDFGHFHRGRATGNSCKIGFVNVITTTGLLDLNIASEIFRKLNIQQFQ